MKKNILIIDDNPHHYDDFILPVEEQYDVTVCMSLRDAERKILSYHYDLIVIDIMMPTIGVSTNDELKTGLYFYKEKLKPLEKERPLLRFLFWSNLSQNTFDDFFHEDKPSNVGFVHKEPRNMNHLLEAINNFLD